MADTVTRCPRCGRKVASFFEHVDIDCEHDMTDAELAALRAQADAAATPEGA